MSRPKIKILTYQTDQQDNSQRVVRAAIYARYSSIGNSPYSADEQILRIRSQLSRGLIFSKMYPGAKIEIAEDWVIKDEAKTGRVTREGYDRIRAGVYSKSFDILLVDDISRTTRDMGDTIDLYERLVFNGVEGFSISDQISTVDPNAKDLFIFKGYANENQSKAISKTTMRGLEVRALQGFSTGHYPYGYRTEPTRHQTIKGIEKPSHFKILINHQQAEIVVRIHSLYADGVGCRAIATMLNKEGMPSPSKRKKSTKLWAEKTVWTLVNQEKYYGVWEYRQTQVVKNPIIDKMIQVPRKKQEWLVTEMEELRIVPIELEEKVKARKAKDTELKKTSKTKFIREGTTPKHLFVGTMKCAECSGNFMMTSGKGYFGCFNAHRTTTIKCSNKQTVAQSAVEAALLNEIKRNLQSPEIFEFMANRYNEVMAKKHGTVPARIKRLEDEISSVEKEVANYARFIAMGKFSETIVKSLSESEAKLNSLTVERNYLVSQNGNKVFVLPQAIRDRLMSLSEVLGQRVHASNEILKRLFFGKILLTPKSDGKRKWYVASGEINLYGLVKSNGTNTVLNPTF